MCKPTSCSSATLASCISDTRLPCHCDSTAGRYNSDTGSYCDYGNAHCTNATDYAATTARSDCYTTTSTNCRCSDGNADDHNDTYALG